MSSFYDSYRRELKLLRERASDFASEHPALAAMLEGPSADPDVERLLEGVAYLTADIRRSADDELGELVQELAQSVCPHLLEPMPAATIIAFAPKANLKETHTIAQGTQVESRPVDGQPCYFETSWDTQVAPWTITDAGRPDLDLPEAEVGDEIRVRLELSSAETPLNTIELDSLRLYISGDFSEAADLHMALVYYGRSARIIDHASGTVTELPADAVRPVGFNSDESLIARPGSTLPAFSALEDYFVFAEKFLFVEVDLTQWSPRGTGSRFAIELICSQPPFGIPQITRERFVLNATPATNTFETESEPVVMDHRETEYVLRPRDGGQKVEHVKSIKKLEGIARGEAERRQFLPFSEFVAGERQGPVYQVRSRQMLQDQPSELAVSVALPPDEPFRYREVLKATLVCTNGDAAESLLPGEIDTPTSDTPELVTFSNLTVPTQSRKPLMDNSQLWHIVSHIALNYLSVANVDNLKSVLRQYAVRTGDQRARDMPNLKRIDSLSSVEVIPGERIVGECLVRGQLVRVKMRHDHFSGYGDRYIFGNVLSHLFANYAAVNTYTELEVEDTATGERLNWDPTFGSRQLI